MITITKHGLVEVSLGVDYYRYTVDFQDKPDWTYHITASEECMFKLASTLRNSINLITD